MTKQIVWQEWCPTCKSVTGHRRRRGTIDTLDCCVCGHGLVGINVTVFGVVLQTVTKSLILTESIFIVGTIGLDQCVTAMVGISSIVFCAALLSGYCSSIRVC